MKQLSKEVYEQIRTWVYRHARHVELTWWQYYFENGSREAAVEALGFFQNEDGGFGNGLEPDCSNPNSSPATTVMAYERLKSLDCIQKDHPMIQGIIRFIEHSEYFTEHGWYWSIPSNNNYPCQPWYLFPNAPWFPKDWPAENYVCGDLFRFVLKYFDKEHEIYQKTLRAIEYRLSHMEKFSEFCAFTNEWNQEDIEANDWVSLIEALEESGIKSADECHRLASEFLKIVDEAALPEIRTQIRKRIEKSEITEAELDAIVDRLSAGNGWNTDGLWGDTPDEKKDLICSVGGVCFPIIGAIEELKKLQEHGRLEIEK
jgi:hypothetical protein